MATPKMFGASVQERQLPSGTTTKPHFLGKVQGFRQRGEMTFYRQGWRDGTLVGNPEVALKVPLTSRLHTKEMPLIFRAISLPSFILNLAANTIYIS
jgi:hypothetical protein